MLRPFAAKKSTVALNPETMIILRLIALFHQFLPQAKDDLIKHHNTQPICWRRVIKILIGLLIYLAFQKLVLMVTMICNSIPIETSILFKMLSTTSKKKADRELVLHYILASKDFNISRVSRR